VTSGRTKLAEKPANAAHPRVLHVISPAAFGGLEQVVSQLATGRARRGLPTEVLALTGADSATPALVERLEATGVKTSVLRSPHRAYLQEQRAIAAAAAAFRADVVHTHGYHPDVLAASAARRAGSGLVSTAHGFTGGGTKNRVFEWLQKRAWRKYDIVAAVSRPLRDRIVRSGVPERVVCLCPNAWSGVEPLDRDAARARLQLPATGRMIGWVGRLSAEKGADVMVRAIPELPADVTVVMIGDGPQRVTLQGIADEMGIASRIRWAGAVQGAGVCMAAFDAFALSSRTEGTPMVLFEAMAARVPIVATAVGGVPDVVSASDAMLVPSESPGALAHAIDHVLREGAAAAGRAEAARQRLDSKYAAEPWLDEYERFYQAAASAPARRR
jgi:glycosyltransferase involved in cell wall biosynthesis